MLRQFLVSGSDPTDTRHTYPTLPLPVPRDHPCVGWRRVDTRQCHMSQHLTGTVVMSSDIEVSGVGYVSVVGDDVEQSKQYHHDHHVYSGKVGGSSSLLGRFRLQLHVGSLGCVHAVPLFPSTSCCLRRSSPSSISPACRCLIAVAISRRSHGSGRNQWVWQANMASRTGLLQPLNGQGRW
jgi:hypothetical protein